MNHCKYILEFKEIFVGSKKSFISTFQSYSSYLYVMLSSRLHTALRGSLIITICIRKVTLLDSIPCPEVCHVVVVIDPVSKFVHEVSEHVFVSR